MPEKLFPEITHPKKRAFLSTYARTCNILQAARAADIDRRSVYHWKRDDEDFRAAFTEAKELGAEALEALAIRLATLGTIKPMTVAGKRVDVTERHITLLIFLLKGAMPEKYRERWEGQLTGKDGQPLLMSEEQSRRLLEASAPPPPTD